MQFLNPIVLLGLAAASIPLILHLLNLRKLKTIDFSTLKFIKELQKTRIRRLKLKQILLLILRTLIIIFTVLAFSRPAIEGHIPGIENFASSSVAILLDNSFSMDVSDESGNRFTQAKNTAEKIISSLKEGDEAILLQMSNADETINNGLTRNFALLKKDLNNCRISYRKADLEKSLRLASAAVEESKNINREIFIISDCQANIFSEDKKDSSKIIANNSGVYVVPIGYGSESDINNLSIDSVNVISRIFQIGKLIETEVTVKNNSKKEAKGAVVSLLFDNERMTQRSIDITESKIKKLPIAAAPQKPGVYDASVELESDALEADNRRYFGFIIHDKPSVALIGDVFQLVFLNKALSLANGAGQQAKVTVLLPNELAGSNLSNFDVIILSSGTYRNSDYQRIIQYIIGGGSALIFAEDAAQPEDFRHLLDTLGFGELQTKTFRDNQPGGFISVDKIHPLFEGVFKGNTDEKSIVESPKIFKAMPVPGGQQIIEMAGGAFLAESRKGEGKVIYSAVSPVESWSSLPYTGLFPTLIYRSILYLTSNSDICVYAEPGSNVMLPLPKRLSSAGAFRIVDPKGNEFFKKAALLPTGSILSLEELSNPGNYIIYSTNNKPVSIISVNTPRSESHLEPVPKDLFRKKLEARSGDDVGIEIIENTPNILKDVQRVRTGAELWQFFLIAALIAAAAEMFVEKNSREETKSEQK
ncbi:MAG: hypothetical protein QG635_99 [Bacteroidota bacterium]|nr:hypothetical protein [Bacteroidota bacterium]